MRKLGLAAVLVTLLAVPAAHGATFPSRSLDGSGNNVAHPDWGKIGTQYSRVAPARYANGISTPVSGPSSRAISNRIYNDRAQNIFSENGVSRWGFVWGQFLDHTLGLRQEAGGESAPIAFDAADPFEEFTSDSSSMSFARTP